MNLHPLQIQFEKYSLRLNYYCHDLNVVVKQVAIALEEVAFVGNQGIGPVQ